MLSATLSRFRRITSGSSWIPEIDGLRFVAIMSVISFHLSAELYSRSGLTYTYHAWYGPILDAFTHGHLGVQLFFVISGFILGRPFARQHLLGQGRVSLKSYYLRRLTRLEPPYLLCLLLTGIAVHFYVHESFRSVIVHALTSAVYLHGIIFRAVSTIIPVAWSLEIEAQFYLLVPLLTQLFRIRSAVARRTLLLVACLVIAYIQGRFLYPHLSGSSPLWLTIVFYLQYFLAGLLLSDLYVLEMTRWRTTWLWDAASVLAWAALFVNGPPWVFLFLPELMLVAYMGAFRGVLFQKIFRTEWVATIGGMCYSIYLWHFFVIAVMFKVSRRAIFFHDFLLNLLVQSAIILPVILLVGGVFFLLVERPCMDPLWPQKLKAALNFRSKRLPV